MKLKDFAKVCSSRFFVGHPSIGYDCIYANYDLPENVIKNLDGELVDFADIENCDIVRIDIYHEIPEEEPIIYVVVKEV